MLKKIFTSFVYGSFPLITLLFINYFSVFSQTILPTSYNGPWFGGTPPTGWSWNMTGGDIPGAGANFNAVGRQMQIDFSCTPFSISFDITPNTLNVGVSKVILVEQFVGGSWVTLATYSWNGSVASPAGLGVLGAPSTLSQTLLLNPSATSVRFNMTVRDAGVGNYGISNVSVMGDPSCGPVLYTTPGTYTWIVPTCVDEITVQAWGGGGGGGSVWSRFDPTSSGPTSNEACVTAGGGGGGGYASRTYTVVPGQVYTIVVGAGGIGGTINSSGNNRANAGSPGGNSTFLGPATVAPGTLTAIGGLGGGAANFLRSCLGGCSGATHQGVNGNGGSGSGGSNGTTTFLGGNGTAGVHAGNTQDRSGAGGGGAGSSGNGGNASSTTGGNGGSGDGGAGGPGIVQPYGSGYLGTNGTNGNTIGGGGGGASGHNRGSNQNTHRTNIGGNGARGEVRILYNNTCTVLLPIELLSFDGKNVNEINELEWYTATESSNDYFTVYRTINGIDWESVGIVSGGGTTQYKQRYLLDDRGFNKGMINYYRLSQTDTDGNIEFIGKIIQIDNRFSNQKKVKSYNIMGQEILPDSKGVVINLFEDGSTQRVYND